MTTSDYPTRTAVLLDTVHEHDHEHEHDMNHEMDHNSYVRPMNEANTTSGMDQIDLDRSISPNRPNSDASSKRSRIQAVFLSRSSNANDKKGNSVLANSVGVLSHPTNNTSGPGGGTNGANDVYEHPNVVATLSQHASAAMPVASLVLPTNKVQTTNTNSTSSSAKQFLIRRVRSHSKSDPQSVPDKSLFSRFFPKKTKKPLPTLLTATTKSIDTNSTINHTKKRTNNNLLTTDYQPSNNYEEDEDDEFDDRTVSMGSLSDTDQQNHKDNRITGTEMGSFGLMS
jgi:hypothetical protein